MLRLCFLEKAWDGLGNPKLRDLHRPSRLPTLGRGLSSPWYFWRQKDPSLDSAEDSPELLNADFVQHDWGKCARSLGGGLIFCDEEWGETTTYAVLVVPLIVFPDAMPMVPHAEYLWWAVWGCWFAFYCALRSFKSHLCSFKRLRWDRKKESCLLALF